MISYYTKVHLSKCNGSWVVSIKRTKSINIQLAAMFVFFIFDKNGLIKSCSSFEDLSVYKISCSHLDWWKFCIHLRNLNVRHFGMVESCGIKKYGLEVIFNDMTFLLNFIKSTNWFKSIRGKTRTDRQTGDLISLSFLFKESRLQREEKISWLKRKT
jgi:hypothetical protein